MNASSEQELKRFEEKLKGLCVEGGNPIVTMELHSFLRQRFTERGANYIELLLRSVQYGSIARDPKFALVKIMAPEIDDLLMHLIAALSMEYGLDMKAVLPDATRFIKLWDKYDLAGKAKVQERQ